MSLMDDDKGGIKVKSFRGDPEEWPTWKRKFRAFLGTKKLLTYLGTSAPEGQEEAWRVGNNLIYSFLALSVEGAAASVVDPYDDNQDGNAAFGELIAKYELQGSVQRSTLHTQLFNDKLGEGEDPDVFIARLEDKRRRLAAFDKTIDDETIMDFVRARLTREYATFNDIIDGYKTITYEAFKERLRAYYSRHVFSQPSSSPGTKSALNTQAGGGAGDAPKYDDRKDNGKHKKRHYRGRGGRGFRGRGGFGGGRGHANPNVRCFICQEKGHYWRQCPNRKEGDPPPSMPSANSALGDVLVTISSIASTASSTIKSNMILWVLDSGCTDHMCNDKALFIRFEKHDGHITTASGERLECLGIGDVYLFIQDVTGFERPIILKNVMYVPNLSKNLLSVRVMTRNRGHVTFHQGGATIKKVHFSLPAVLEGTLYVVTTSTDSQGDLKAGSGTSDKSSAHDDPSALAASSSSLWHQRLGHRNGEDMRKLGNMAVGIPQGLKINGKCDTCEVAKHVRASFPASKKPRSKNPWDLVFTDVMGPVEPSLGGARYAVMFTDDATRWRVIYPMKAKSDTLAMFKQYIKDIGVLMKGRKVKAVSCLRSDNGGEYIGEEFMDYCKDQGILQNFTAPESASQNGVSERGWRTIVGTARCLREQAGLPKSFWAEAASTAVYITNRMPTSSLDGDTPYHALFGKHAQLDHLRSFGCRAYAHYYDHERKKLDPKAWRGLMMGYDEYNRRIYRIYDPDTKKLHRTMHVTFDEESFPYKDAAITSTGVTEVTEQVGAQPVKGITSQLLNEIVDAVQHKMSQQHGSSDGASSSIIDESRDTSYKPTGWKQFDEIMSRPQTFGRSLRSGKTIPCQMGGCGESDPHQAHYAFAVESGLAFAAASTLSDDPSSYEEALRSPDAEMWKTAMKEEYDALVKTGTWELCELPAGANAIGSRWVFKTKRDEAGRIARYKARFVAQGFSQLANVDYFDTYAPVAKLSSVRVILALAAPRDWELDNMDVDTAFLQSPVKEVIYVKQPKGYERKGPEGRELVCRVLKSLYGLKQAPRNWNKVINDWLVSYGFRPSKADPCVYVLVSHGGDILVVVLYVDDLIIAGSNRSMVDAFKKAISQRFSMKDLGALKWILGMEVRRNRQLREIELSQTAYFDKVLERFGMTDCHPVGTPAEGHLTRDPDGALDREYMCAVGCLLYAVMTTRPDMAFAVQRLGRHVQASGDDHWRAVKRALRYLKGTRTLGLKYINSMGALLCFCDADYGEDLDTRRSTTAYVFMLSGGAVSWASRLQPTVALSSTEAEYMATSSAVQEAVYMRRLFFDLGFEQVEPTKVHQDNQGCIALSNNPIYHKRTKHIDVRFHYIREKVESHEVELVHVPTERQLADLLTKPLPRVRLAMLRDIVLGYVQY